MHVYLCKWVVRNLGLAIELIVPLHTYNRIHIWSAFMLFDISDLYEAWHMLELFLPSVLTAARGLEIPIGRTAKKGSLNPLLPGLS